LENPFYQGGSMFD